MARAYGVTTILDLRSEGERISDALSPPGFRVENVSLFDDFDSDPAYRAEIGVRVAGRSASAAYRTLYMEALDRNRDMFGRAVEIVADAEGTTLIHCVGGKDRTGVLAALILRIADVPVTVVDEDYRESERLLGVPDSAPASVMDCLLGALEETHGGIDGFLMDAGASRQALYRVRAKLTAAV